MSEKNVFERVAEKNNTTPDKVKSEILYAVFCGSSNSPEIWADITGTLEEKILHLAHLSLSHI